MAKVPRVKAMLLWGTWPILPSGQLGAPLFQVSLASHDEPSMQRVDLVDLHSPHNAMQSPFSSRQIGYGKSGF